ncbi:MAG: glycosyltransferase [Prevotellaceae bacterium]|nr:glycosyltransferase [Prevotellaceae bacterium]
MNIKVSIIVPVYNTSALLPKCIDSLVNQTLQDIEIILVNDASTDNSIEIIRQYEQQYQNKIRVIDSKINQRQGGARNLGIEMAKGEYIGFVDSDDWANEEMYNALYNEAVKEDSDICYCYRQQITENGKIYKDSATYFLPVGKITAKNCRKMLISHVTYVQRYIYKRSLFINRNIRFPAHVRYEDMMIDPLILLYANNISAIKKPFYNYFIHSGSTMTETNETKYQDKIKVCQLIIEEYKQRGYYEQYKHEINYLFFRKAYIHAALNYIINANSPQKKIIAQIRHQLLLLDENYRKNPYYRGKIYFFIIDRLLSMQSAFLIKILKKMLKIMRYNL